MKGGGLFLLIIVLVGGYFVWTQLGGEFSGSAPAVDRPNIEAPDPNEVGDKATEYGNRGADMIAGLSTTAWRWILIGLASLGLTMLWFRRPGFKWAVIGGIIMLVIMIGIVPQL